MNDNFCVLPFFGYEYQVRGGTHCCLLPTNYNIDSVRQSILDGERSEYCSACWKLEDAGLISDRKLKNSALDFYWDRDIRYIEEDVRQGKYETIMVKNVTSNTCNSTCVTCNSGASSAWAPLENKMNLTPALTSIMTKEQIDNNLKFKDLITLNFVGGEPLYEKLNFYILEKLIENNNDTCFIQITTNGSVGLSDKNKSLLGKFKNINFNVSIDGVGKVFEYLRYPLQWDDLLENLDLFRSITKNVSVSYTTSNLNVLYHHETIQWFQQQGLNYHFNPVINPPHFRPNALPQKVKEEIFKKYGKTDDLKFFLEEEHTPQDDTDFQIMLSKIKQQDLVKGIDYKEYLPELANLFWSLTPPTSA